MNKDNFDYIGSILSEYWLIKKNCQIKSIIKRLMKYIIVNISWCFWWKNHRIRGGGFLLVYCKKNQLRLKKDYTNYQ